MEKFNFAKLQNGSDIRGIALPGVPGEDVNLTPEVIEDIAGAFAVWLSNKTNKNPNEITVAIGHDSRLSAPEIKLHLSNVLTNLGINIYDAGLASTPAMYMATIFPEFACDGAIMITASHLPKNRNGFKFFTAEGGFESTNIMEVLGIAQGLHKTSTICLDKVLQHDAHGTLQKKDLMGLYSKFLRDMIAGSIGTSLSGDANKPLSGIHIVVDAGNGAGGFYSRDVLEALGADISGSQFLEPDGEFPNHEPNPENKEAMASIKKAVSDNNADLGLIFDTDVDRSSAVDSKGRDISRNSIVAMAAALIADEYPGTTIVTDSVTSTGLTDFLTNTLGLKHHRFKRGYKNVINESKRLGTEGIDSQLAIETSGHAAFKENAYLDDGAYLATKIVIKAAKLKADGKGIEELIADLKHPAEAEEFRFKLTSEAYGPYGDIVLSDLEKWVKSQKDLSLETPNHEGVRVNFGGKYGGGWALLRKSLHDPIMPLNIESEQSGGIKLIGTKLMEFLSSYEELNADNLKGYIAR